MRRALFQAVETALDNIPGAVDGLVTPYLDVSHCPCEGWSTECRVVADNDELPHCYSLCRRQLDGDVSEDDRLRFASLLPVPTKAQTRPFRAVLRQ